MDKFKLKVFDQILDICHLKKCEAVEKEIETGELDCTNGVANISAMLWFAQGENWRAWGKTWGRKSQKTSNFKANWAIYLDYNQQ